MPLHFTAFHPDHKLTSLPRTPAATLTRARTIARSAGLHHVYTGNVHDTEGGTTTCPGCGHAVIVRDWYRIVAYDLGWDGRCLKCRCQVPGHFEAFTGQWGPRRVPVTLNR